MDMVTVMVMATGVDMVTVAMAMEVMVTVAMAMDMVTGMEGMVTAMAVAFLSGGKVPSGNRTSTHQPDAWASM